MKCRGEGTHFVLSVYYMVCSQAPPLSSPEGEAWIIETCRGNSRVPEPTVPLLTDSPAVCSSPEGSEEMRGRGGGTVGVSKPRLPTLKTAPREWRWSVGALTGVTVKTPFLLWLKCCALISCQPLCVWSNYPFTGPRAHVFYSLAENWVALTQQAAPGGLGFRCPATPATSKPHQERAAHQALQPWAAAGPLRQLEAQPRLRLGTQGPGRPLPGWSVSCLPLGWPCFSPPDSKQASCGPSSKTCTQLGCFRGCLPFLSTASFSNVWSPPAASPSPGPTSVERLQLLL